jgi:hypothetical protein
VPMAPSMIRMRLSAAALRDGKIEDFGMSVLARKWGGPMMRRCATHAAI